jgi:hypothetical protein
MGVQNPDVPAAAGGLCLADGELGVRGGSAVRRTGLGVLVVDECVDPVGAGQHLPAD